MFRFNSKVKLKILRIICDTYIMIFLNNSFQYVTVSKKSEILVKLCAITIIINNSNYIYRIIINNTYPSYVII